ncbi:MAG: hypothetical protein GYB68_15050 [Chloroflexi bacterium]|nr:hypothetical protein [Chloroflexota bacterium]
MDNFQLVWLVPFATWHWTTIFNYGIILICLFLVVGTSGDVPILFLVGVALVAFAGAANLYSNLFAAPLFLIFVIRTIMLAGSLALAGLAPTEETRGIAIVMNLFTFPIFVMLIINCFLPGFIQDPRVLGC